MSDHPSPDTEFSDASGDTAASMVEDAETAVNTVAEAALPAPAAEAIYTAEELERLTGVQETIEAWMRDRIYGSPIAHTTAAYNHLRQALPELARNIVKGL